MSKKGIDTPTSARIRENQRRSRNRRKELIEDLQKRVQEYEEQGVAATQEMQRAARKVAEENLGLRNLLAWKGVSKGEIDAYLRGLRVGAGEEAREQVIEVARAGLVSTSPRVLQPQIVPMATNGHGQGPAALNEKAAQLPLPSQQATFDPQLSNTPEPGQDSEIRIEALSSNTTASTCAPQHDHRQQSSMPNLQPPEEPGCPNTTDCFCAPPAAPSSHRLPSPGEEISCEAAAIIIVEMRGDGDIDSARASLGCHGSEECNVKNSTVLQVMDEG